ncbi:amino acid ABC transporter substrate-binding protein, PAAT family [Pelosinus fermentans]|uniref:basic amino acid ABC transporter substrate-binding protein n=1 Tax=Pelosinus fermentans TaxID=365349 RepID=UPI0002685FB5|nr:basic amino acid ABC transporter substrate-binding protein [Pelosinus fermentans]OAM92888.1 ABC-type transporter, periplasmic subunit family 3 [Pelosinus fermentans DSM 17108]SDQ60013.1 amino acid ABC transporter substrate-binding protein, PAAT family [Pelosinus fermentans]
MSKKIMSLLIIVVLIASFGLAGCSKEGASTAKVLKVGTDAGFAPFEFQDEKSKEYVGFDMDLIKALGKQMGYEVQIQNMNFDGLIPGLEVNSIDAVASGMTITEARKQKVNFTKPYYQAGLTIVVKNDNNTIKNFKDLEGKKIAVQIGTTGAAEAKKIKDAQVREFNNAPEAFMELKAGGVDAVVNDKPVNEYYIAQSGSKDAKAVGEPLQAEEYGIAVAKKNTELAGKLDKALDELKKNGEYEKIYVKWFGKKPGI